MDIVVELSLPACLSAAQPDGYGGNYSSDILKAANVRGIAILKLARLQPVGCNAFVS